MSISKWRHWIFMSLSRESIDSKPSPRISDLRELICPTVLNSSLGIRCKGVRNSALIAGYLNESNDWLFPTFHQVRPVNALSKIERSKMFPSRFWWDCGSYKIEFSGLMKKKVIKMSLSTVKKWVGNIF